MKVGWKYVVAFVVGGLAGFGLAYLALAIWMLRDLRHGIRPGVARW